VNLGIGSTNQVLTVVGGVPTWQAAGTLTSVTTDQMLVNSGTSLASANATSTSVVTATGTTNTYAGRVQVKNTSGGTLGTITVRIPNTNVGANSVVIASVVFDGNSATGNEYVVNVTNIDGTNHRFDLLLHRATPTASSSFNNNEGCTVHWMVIN
jgi:hypothetical protein